jgi:hypothetical protein
MTDPRCRRVGKRLEKEASMKPSSPKQITWIIGLILGILGLLGYLVPTLPVVPQYAYWLTAAGFIVLALGTSLKGL